MEISIYNSSENLIFTGTYDEFLQLKENHLINGSDKTVFN